MGLFSKRSVGGSRSRRAGSRSRRAGRRTRRMRGGVCGNAHPAATVGGRSRRRRRRRRRRSCRK